MAEKVLITGSNGGFGKLITELLLKEGHEVAASMRGIGAKNKETAEAMSALGAHVVEIDVALDESVSKGVADAIDQLGGLDIVINNAGVGVMGMQEHFTIDDWKKLFEVNVYGVQRINRTVLPHLRKQGSGLIIYISSLLGRMALPFYGPYNASKWALEALAESYRVELSGFGIENVIVEPGGFETSFFGSLIQPSDQSRNVEYGDFMNAPQQMGEGFGEALASNHEQDPQKVADAVYQLIAMEKGKRPFRTIVDYMGMGDPLKGYNEQLDNITKNVYGNLQIDNMLEVK
ncbi:MAG: SDR family oxidoreductase [Bacteroidota bacterium]